jgi:hypothetical protein
VVLGAFGEVRLKFGAPVFTQRTQGIEFVVVRYLLAVHISINY